MAISRPTADYSGHLDSMHRQNEKLQRGSEKLLRDNERLRSERNDLRKRTETLLADNTALRTKLNRLEAQMEKNGMASDVTSVPMTTPMYLIDDKHERDGNSTKPKGSDLDRSHEMYGRRTAELPNGRKGATRTSRLASWLNKRAPVGSRVFKTRHDQPRYSSQRYFTPRAGNVSNTAPVSGPPNGTEGKYGGYRHLARQKRTA